jgi:hypothetical protein
LKEKRQNWEENKKFHEEIQNLIQEKDQLKEKKGRM